MKEKLKNNVNAGAVDETVETECKNTIPTFNDILSNREYQAEFDRRVQKAIETAKKKWKRTNTEEFDDKNLSKKIKSVFIKFN